MANNAGTVLTGGTRIMVMKPLYRNGVLTARAGEKGTVLRTDNAGRSYWILLDGGWVDIELYPGEIDIV